MGIVSHPMVEAVAVELVANIYRVGVKLVYLHVGGSSGGCSSGIFTLWG